MEPITLSELIEQLQAYAKENPERLVGQIVIDSQITDFGCDAEDGLFRVVGIATTESKQGTELLTELLLDPENNPSGDVIERKKREAGEGSEDELEDDDQ